MALEEVGNGKALHGFRDMENKARQDLEEVRENILKGATYFC